jgi:P-type Mg2+ transporter
MKLPSNDAFWRLGSERLLDRLRSRKAGLTQREARERLLQFGRNTVVERRRTWLPTRLAKRFAEPLVAILLIAAAISGVTGDFASFAIILTVVTLSIVLDVIQEHRAAVAAEALRHSVAIRADVRRDGAIVSIPVEEVVPGDVVELRAGDVVPADGVVLHSRNVHVNEALMTGEPFPVEKRADACTAESPAEAFNALFAGTSVVSGEATTLVVATGGQTRFGGIAAALDAGETPSALERGVHRLGLLILRLTVFLVLFVLLVHVAFGRPALDSFLFAVALAVGLTPELLPMIMTVTLSRGAIRMAEKRVIVKRLGAIHDLGAMDVLCTDKTGTLTEARISLVGYPGIDGNDSERVLTLAAINGEFESGIRSPLDEAILQCCPRDRLSDWSKIDEVPFDFDRRRISILAEKQGECVLVIKGAPETVIALATSIEGDGGKVVPLDETARATLARLHDERAAQGYRLLAVAWKTLPADQRELKPEDERDLVVAGFCVFVDPPKAGAAEAISRLACAGVQIKVVSGDHEMVVRHLAETLGIAAHGLLTGTEIGELTDPALAARVEEVDLFARVLPDQKTRIIRALQHQGHTVGFLGDGVNDAPAIHAAEVGLSVEGATDVARAAADMIMLDRNLGVLADGVEEGRRTFANILKYVRMGTSSNFGNMLSMALASLVLPFLPLLPVQILLNNLLYDLSEVGIPFDSVDRDELTGPRAWDMRAILRFTLIMGSLSSLFDLATFAVLLQVFHSGPELFRTAWFIESMATQILVIFVIRTWGPAWSSRTDGVLVASSLGALAVACGIALSPVGRAFDFVAVPALLLLTIGIIVVVYLCLAEVIKSWAQRANGRA